VYHQPRPVPVQVIRYHYPRDYHVVVHRRHIYRRWIQEPVIFTYYNGYWEIDSYPYYVHQGYRYRYNPVELCQYDLVDGADYTLAGRTSLMACNQAYDTCAAQRDELNRAEGVERFFCAESVDDDLLPSEEDTYLPLPTDMTPERQAVIEAYLARNNLMDIFNDGWYGGIEGGACRIVKLRGNEHGCRWMVKVGEEFYPDIKGSVCSTPKQAALIGCNVGDEKLNAGCILEKAVTEGYCH
jgi:hypothetical protein